MATPINKNQVGGNGFLVILGKLLLQIGKYLTKKGDRFIYLGNARIISNPKAEWLNPFTIIYTFVIDNTEKYQLIIQNTAYKDRYKENNQEISLSEEDLYQVIRSNRNLWFLKQ